MGNTFTRPPRVLGGNRQAIRAEHFNTLSRAIEELQNAMRPSGPQANRPNIKNPPPFWTAISQVPESDPAEWQVAVTLGYLTYQNAGASAAEQGVTGYIVPTVQGVSLESEEVEPLPLPGVDSWVYLRVKTDSDGVPKFATEGGPVTIEAFDAAQQSVHHVRPSPSGGEEEGDYFFLILQTEGDGGTPERPRVVRRITGNRELPNQLIEIENLGDQDAEGVRALYEGYDPGPGDKHKFRSLEQLLERGEAIIKPLDTGEQPGDTIPFRSIAERATSPQVRVTTSESGEVIQIEGNGRDRSYIDPFGGQITFEDGLCLEVQGGAFNGWYGTIEWVYEAAGGSEETYLHLRQTFTNGILSKVEYWSGTVPVDAPGTEATPGGVVFNMIDS